MKVLYLTELPCWHTENDLIQFRKLGFEILLANAHPNYSDKPSTITKEKYQIVNFYEIKNNILSKKIYPFNKILLSKTRSVTKRIRILIEEWKPDIIYTSWSSAIVPEILFLKKCFPDLPIIWRLLMYPAATNRLISHLEHIYCRNALKEIDGLILPTSNLELSLKRTFGNILPRTLILPEYLSRDYFTKNSLNPLSETYGESHIVFLGTLEKVQRYRHNDVRLLLTEIANLGIHVHISCNNKLLDSPKIHSFPYIPFGTELAFFLTQFDACLVCYDLSQIPYKERFDNVIPNRLISATIGELPIALEKGVSKSSEEFIQKFGIGFTFQTASQLREVLSNQNSLRLIKERYQRCIKDIQYDSHIDDVLCMFHTVIEENKK